jgi:hypothetical protein
MDAAEMICREARRLPEALAQEVLDFLEYVQAKHGVRDPLSEQLGAAQSPVMARIWDNPDDEVWNEV